MTETEAEQEPAKTDGAGGVGNKPEFGVTGRKIIYDKDGKPCNSLLDFRVATSGSAKKPAIGKEIAGQELLETVKDNKECPADVEVLGRSSWTLLHTIAARYPEKASNKQQADLKQFLKLFGHFYPCTYCGEDFQTYLQKTEPAVEGQDRFGQWLCEAHNDVNTKLGKPTFDCNLWKQRWKDGWNDGRCD